MTASEKLPPAAMRPMPAGGAASVATKVAVQAMPALIVTAPAGQFGLQAEKVKPAAGVAVNVTAVLSA